MKDLKRYYVIPAEPEILYRALTVPATIELWSGASAVMSTESGSSFSLWEGSISGTNLDFIEGKMIVQEWDFGDQEASSIVTIKLHPHKNGTSVELRQTNIPDEAFDDLSAGWDENYFGALLEFYS